jgi:hypothetical protein
LHRACRAPVIEHPARAAGAVEASEREYLAGHEPAGFLAIQDLSGESRRDYRTSRQCSQY